MDILTLLVISLLSGQTCVSQACLLRECCTESSAARRKRIAPLQSGGQDLFASVKCLRHLIVFCCVFKFAELTNKSDLVLTPLIHN